MFLEFASINFYDIGKINLQWRTYIRNNQFYDEIVDRFGRDTRRLSTDYNFFRINKVNFTYTYVPILVTCKL